MISTPQPAVSVCIANYNGEAMLVDCIESVLRQITDFTVEIIVHDDASTDASILLIRNRYPQVILIESAENVGFCISNNRMVDRARGQYVLLLNNDAELWPDAIQALMAEAADEAVGVLSLPQYDWQTGMLVDRGCLLDPLYCSVPNLNPTKTEVAYVVGACLFMRRLLWRELGGFPDWMGSIGEDLYLCGRARLSGLAVRVLNVSGYRHRQGASFGGNRMTEGGLLTTYRRRHLSERNRGWALFLLTPTALAYPWLALYILLLVVEGTVLSVLKLDARIWSRIYFRTASELLRSITFMTGRRRRIQAERTISLRIYLRAFTPVLRKVQLFARSGLPTLR
jgi:GT2 family glycosyltransferase